jgi:hypothetical protein
MNLRHYTTPGVTVSAACSDTEDRVYVTTMAHNYHRAAVTLTTDMMAQPDGPIAMIWQLQGVNNHWGRAALPAPTSFTLLSYLVCLIGLQSMTRRAMLATSTTSLEPLFIESNGSLNYNTG